jgi:hypothetical protein
MRRVAQPWLPKMSRGNGARRLGDPDRTDGF